MDAALRSMLNQTVTLEPWASQDGYGKPTYGASASYAAQVVHKNRLVRDDRGQEAVAATQVILDGDVSVTTKDRITLTGAVPTTPPILTVEKYPDERGTISLTVLSCGAMPSR